MKTLMLLLPLLALALAYTDVSDKFIEDSMLTNQDNARKETKDFTACLLDEGPCSDFNAKAKTHLIQAMGDGCAECDTVQKRGAVRLLKIMKSDFPDMWEKFEKKYDTGRTSYDQFIQKLSVYA